MSTCLLPDETIGNLENTTEVSIYPAYIKTQSKILSDSVHDCSELIKEVYNKRLEELKSKDKV